MDSRTRSLEAEPVRLTSPLDLFANVSRVWLACWTATLAAVTWLNFAVPEASSPARLLSYAGIFSCFVFALTAKRRDPLLVAALAITAIADYFLILFSFVVPGLIAFCCVQLLHAIRLRRLVPTNPAPFFIALTTMVVAGIILRFSLIFMLGSLYACVLLHNLLAAKKFYDDTNYAILSARIFWGFALFVACDVCVALGYLTGENAIASILPATFFSSMTYVFYLPSQVLLALSGARQNKPTSVKLK